MFISNLRMYGYYSRREKLRKIDRWDKLITEELYSLSACDVSGNCSLVRELGVGITFSLRPSCTGRVGASGQMGRPCSWFPALWLIFPSEVSLQHCPLLLRPPFFPPAFHFSVNECPCPPATVVSSLPRSAVLGVHSSALRPAFTHTFSPFPPRCPSPFVVFSLLSFPSLLILFFTHSPLSLKGNRK